MKSVKKIVCILMVVVMCLASSPLQGFVGLEWSEGDLFAGKARALSATGQCGDNVFWTFDETTGELVISGEGKMWDDESPVLSDGGNIWGGFFEPSVELLFENALEVQFVLINEGVTSIGENAFYGCSNLKSITFSSSVTSIGPYAFSRCSSLTNIKIPSGVTSIGKRAFNKCASLTSVTIPDGVTSLGDSVFGACESLTSIIVDNNNKYFYNDEYGVLFDKNKTILIQYPGGNSRLSYTIPDGITKIGGGAFEGCRNLTSTTIPDSVTTIDKGAFEDCTSLTSITLPNGITSIGSDAFNGCESLTNIMLPDSILFLGDAVFGGCKSLTSITIPGNVTSIGVLAFSGCSNLTSITIPSSVTSIGEWAFSECTSLTSIIIPESVTSISELAFFWCPSLTSITVDGGNEYYSNDESGVLFDKDKATLIQYPEGNSRTSYTVPNSVSSIGYGAFAFCTSLTNIVISDSVTNIGNTAFGYCENLRSIIIPDSVTYIDEAAFVGCSNLTNVTIPDSVTFIGYGGFNSCDNLTDAYYTGTKEQWNAIEIGEENDSLLNATIHFNSTVHTHTPKTITIPPTCTVSGKTYTVCETCGETIGEPTFLPAAHTPGEWETVQDSTAIAEGKKVLRCTVCGEIIEEAAIPMLQVVSDKGIDLVFSADDYDGEIDVIVEESSDGTAFDIIDTSVNTSQKLVYDIKMTLNGEEIQPNGKVTIRIPLPVGYAPERSFVYHVNTATGKVEKMDARYEDGYLVFETDHFSYYAVLEIAEDNPSANCKCNCHKSGIVKFFYNIILFFQRIFRQNKTCVCGVEHY
ncbi:MAG: leucine-rich repeat domain-containing protein [Acutalibacteraceae bacterium]